MVDLPRAAAPLLNVASYARRGPGHRSLSRAEIEHISRTVRRVPEVVVKVSGGARTLQGVGMHLDYIGREGEGEITTDDGRTIREKGFEQALIEDWDLDLQVRRRYTARATSRRVSPKLVHNLVFSMPRGTDAKKVLAAVQVFAREKLALKHRYAMTLHTDQGHPHVHLVVKAVSEECLRLNIRKATLREWRQDFARCLRDLGIEANASERAVRGQIRSTKHDGIYRAMARRESTFARNREETLIRELHEDRQQVDQGAATLVSTRRAVVRGWQALARTLELYESSGVAASIREFVATMPAPRTERAIRVERMRSVVDHGAPTR